MKRLIIFFSLSFIAAVIFNGCYTEDIHAPITFTEVEYAPLNVSFNNDLAPLFKKNCTDVGCHVTGGKVPYMDDVKLSFKNIVGGNYINIVFPKESRFYSFVYGEMSQYTTKDERQLIYDWIRNGAKNN